MAEHLRDFGYMQEQVQDFYPTPSTLSTCMYYTGLDPRDMSEVYVPKNPHEKAMQRALIQYRDPKNYDLVLEALRKTGRMDLVGFGKECLLRPKNMQAGKDSDRGNKAYCKGKTEKAGRSGRTGQKKKRTIRNVHKKK